MQVVACDFCKRRIDEKSDTHVHIVIVKQTNGYGDSPFPATSRAMGLGLGAAHQTNLDCCSECAVSKGIVKATPKLEAYKGGLSDDELKELGLDTP